MLLDMIGVTQHPALGKNLAQDLFAAEEGQGPEIVAFAGDQVEGKKRGGQLGGAGQLGALLQTPETGPARLIQYHDFAIENKALEGKRLDGAGDVGIAHGEIVAVAAEEP